MPRAKTIWRIENRAGNGAYSCQEFNSIRRMTSQKQPLPLFDGFRIGETPMTNVPVGALFGFANKRQLRRWFTKPELRTLFQAGYEVRRFRVPRDFVIYGKSQVCFHGWYRKL